MTIQRKSRTAWYFMLAMLFVWPSLVSAQKDKGDKKDKVMSSGTFSGLKLRSIGPAFASGRIADFAINPNNTSEWYVGVASGNLWKTTNNGQTFKPIFENKGTYSIGALAMDPNNSRVVWAGTGENNHQRATAYGDGVYKTMDGGKSWKNMGLKNSRQIGMIAIDPKNSDIVFVAAEGSMWGSSTDRGLYKTTDGGATWTKVLNISENTGVNNVIIDPRDSRIMYATSEQRRRHVHTKIGGGPESAVYKSTDGGTNWRKLTSGLPSGHVGGMGMAISPVNPDYVFLIIEAQVGKGGFFRSTDRGESWKKMSSHHASGQYYNEIFCDPIDVDKVYSMETVSKVTFDGGATWKNLGLKNRHVDDHAFWVDPNDTDHFIIGGDGGVYVSYDAGKNYSHVSNLPITQYYRVAVDNTEPFYWVYGGTQDNNSMGGPSRNTSTFGVVSDDWVVTVGGDGFQTQIDPKDPNIVYSEYQYGNIYRYDKRSGERLYVKPKEGKGELTYRWNWNAPVLISPHANKRLYMAANKVFRTDDRGQSWKVISEDLTAQLDRTNTWKVMGKYWITEAVRKDVSTSQYGTIVSLVESSVKENLLFAGTDDGLIQVCEDASAETPKWTKYSSFGVVPANTYVSDIFASRFDENVVFASFDNMKRDDFKPYLMKSTNKGKSWTMITNGLPENGTVHTIEQDFVNKNLLFAGTEFGVYFSVDGGSNWIQMKSGIPTIAVRDLVIQQRESDLVMATFGRGFYVLDDYSPLRTANKALFDQNAHLFPIKDAWMFLETDGRYGQGATYYGAKNPAFGAVFTYYLKEVPKTQKQIRMKKEKELFKNGEKIPQLSWKELEEQNREIAPYLVFTVTDEAGNVVRKFMKKPSKGINRVNWNLRYGSTSPMRLRDNKFNPNRKARSGMLAMPGKYKVSISMVVNGTVTKLTEAAPFTAKALNNTTLPAADRKALVAFQQKVMELVRIINGTETYLGELVRKVAHLKQAALETPNASPELMNKITQAEKDLNELLFIFNGAKGKASGEEIPPQQMPLGDRLNSITRPHWRSTSSITKVQTDAFAIVKEEFTPVYNKIKEMGTVIIPAIEKDLEAIHAPFTPGRLPDWK